MTCAVIMQSLRASTTTTSTTRSACAATLAASTWRAPARSGRAASRIKSFATCTLPTSLWWSRPTLCSSCAASNRSRSAVPSPAVRAARRSSSHCHRRPVQVNKQTNCIHLFLSSFLYRDNIRFWVMYVHNGIVIWYCAAINLCSSHVGGCLQLRGWLRRRCRVVL